METKQYERLLEILNKLRVECPWDRKQTFDSLRSNTIEECFELCDALTDKDYMGVKEELGDMLLHIIFYSKIAEEQGLFNIEDVAEFVSEKLIYRHPHVFGDVKVKNDEEVSKNWAALKLKEKKGDKTGVLAGVPRSLPALIKAYRMQKKAANVGFDWDNKEDVWNKVKEEIAEFEAEIDNNDFEAQQDEFGDLLFSLINAGRKLGIDPEVALEKCNKKFLYRFNYIEKHSDKPINEMTLPEMEDLWVEAKKH
ncbi:MAG: nucleoside triphosphate pyrophosphohydrolase [Rikenellaceae bacterium]